MQEDNNPQNTQMEGKEIADLGGQTLRMATLQVGLTMNMLFPVTI